ncbi:BREX-3 system P-loop-containing protein BrxF [Bacillus sp. AFS017336]|uniref:BREX-3 system P-loop-containing protein BrxF n=1 Tax=Bacillus sp. AFS017336 TaxID=2033489 RepID=UPI000BF10922|nr:BREX-3 system P-loop-containing protein BrxF [Bacillus sp. AFS017336]PEK99500.1 virulence associated protein [Bacillus sp. AFS017336]
MNFDDLNQEISNLKYQYHKLLFLCNDNLLHNKILKENKEIQVVNVNLLLSELLLTISKKQYSLFVDEFLRKVFIDKEKIYVLDRINVLFDTSLQTNPVRLMENISKQHQLVVVWPGKYENGELIYAEQSHPEYFTCSNFEGKVIS